MNACDTLEPELLDAALGFPVTAGLRRHVEGCAACAAALAGARRATLAFTAGHAKRRLLVSRWTRAAAAVALVSAAAYLLRQEPAPTATWAAADLTATVPAPPLSTAFATDPAPGAKLACLSPTSARLDGGRASFSIGAAGGVVETPLGRFGCNDCEFTLELVDAAAAGLPAACEPDQNLIVHVRAGALAALDAAEPLVHLAGERVLISAP